MRPPRRSAPLTVCVPCGSTVAVLCAIAVLTGCGSSTPTRRVVLRPPPAPSPTPTPTPAPVVVLDRIDLQLDAPNGLSGLTIDGNGVLYAIAETGHEVVRIEDDEEPVVVLVSGIEHEVDTESIAWLGGARFALGTESMDVSRTSERIYFVELDEDSDGATASVVGGLDLPLVVNGVTAEENVGIEGLCHCGGFLVAALENVIVEEEQTRYAPIATYPLGEGDGTWRDYRVALTTDSGKIAALDCRLGDDGLEVFAVERHYEVMRILRWRIPPGDWTAVLTPEVVVDLSGRLEGDPNLEGLALLDRDILLVVDNQYGERTGPNELVRIQGAAAPNPPFPAH